VSAGKIMSMKNSNDSIGNRTLDLLTFSSVPQQTAPPRGAFPLRLQFIGLVSLIFTEYKNVLGALQFLRFPSSHITLKHFIPAWTLSGP